MTPSTPDELIRKHLQGDASGPERAQLADWLDRSPANRRQFEQSLTAWQSVPDPAAGMDFATGAQWQQLAAQLQRDPASPVPDVPAGKSIPFQPGP